MKWSNRIALVLLCVVALASAKAYAGGADTPPGDPPHGVAFMEKAKGTKLSGVIAAELTDVDLLNATASAFRGTLRLRRGGQIATFYTQVEDTHHCFDPDPNVNDCVRFEFSGEVSQIQDALVPALVGGTDGILATFFPDECPGGVCSLVVTVKLVEEFAQINSPVTPGLPSPPEPLSLFFVTDVVLAVK